MSEHYDQLIQKPKVIEAIKEAGYVSSKEFDKVKLERNILIHTLLAYKKEIESIYDSRHNPMPNNDFFKTIFKKNIITTDFIKEHIVTFLTFAQYSNLDKIALAEKGEKRKKVIKENIIKLALSNSRKDSNFQNLTNIFNEEHIKNTKYFFLFFDTLDEVEIKNLSDLNNSEISEFVESNFNKVLELIINN